MFRLSNEPTDTNEPSSSPKADWKWDLSSPRQRRTETQLRMKLQRPQSPRQRRRFLSALEVSAASRRQRRHQRNTCAWRCVCNSAPWAWQTDLRPPTDAGRGHPSPLRLRFPQTSHSCRSDAAVRFCTDKTPIICFICTNISQELSVIVSRNSPNNHLVAKISAHFVCFWLRSSKILIGLRV